MLTLERHIDPYEPHTRECDASYLHSCFSQGFYLTTEHKLSFQKYEAESPKIIILKVEQAHKIGLNCKEDMLTLMGSKLENMTLPTPILTWVMLPT